MWGLWTTWVDTEAIAGTHVWPHALGASYLDLSLGSVIIGFEQVTELSSASTLSSVRGDHTGTQLLVCREDSVS